MTKRNLRKNSNKERYKNGYITAVQKGGTYMSSTKVKKLFRLWLKENLHRFNYKPYAKNSVGSEYYFEGIAKNITLVMDYSSPEAMMSHDNPIKLTHCWDYDVVEYIGDERLDKEKGYYDADRVDGIYDYFPTQKDLYIHNVFEKIIDYVNSKFVKENALYLLQLGFSSSSKIAPKKDYEKSKESFTTSGATTSREEKMYCFNLFTGKQLHSEY